MTAEEYVKHYVSGQGGFESVSVDVALRAIEYAKEEAKQQMMANAIDGIAMPNDNEIWCDLKSFDLKEGDKVKVIILKKEDDE